MRVSYVHDKWFFSMHVWWFVLLSSIWNAIMFKGVKNVGVLLNANWCHVQAHVSACCHPYGLTCACACCARKTNAFMLHVHMHLHACMNEQPWLACTIIIMCSSQWMIMMMTCEENHMFKIKKICCQKNNNLCVCTAAACHRIQQLLATARQQAGMRCLCDIDQSARLPPGAIYACSDEQLHV